MKRLAMVACLAGCAPLASAELFVGIETSPSVPARVTDMAGFPNVTYTDLWSIDVAAAAATPDGTIYIANGAFTTDLYEAALDAPPQFAVTLSVDIAAMGYLDGTLYGYSNYASPKGIYEIDPQTGQCTLALDIYTGTGFRFFALAANPRDGLLYGYTEYGDSGLYSINLDTGELIKLAGTIPASNGQGRGMAVGNDTVYLTATRGDDGIGFYAYDLDQGVGGAWVEFDNAYPNHHSTGGAAWIMEPCPGDLNGDGLRDLQDLGILLASYEVDDGGDIDGDGDTDLGDLGNLLAVYDVPCP
jgi:hypothetical protein